MKNSLSTIARIGTIFGAALLSTACATDPCVTRVTEVNNSNNRGNERSIWGGSAQAVTQCTYRGNIPQNQWGLPDHLKMEKK